MTPDTNTAIGAAARFIKKPVTIEAVQYTEAVRDAYLFDKVPLPHGVVIPATTLHPPSRKVYSARAYIDTLEGRMTVSIGDWIIKGVKGEMYSCKDEIFRLTYSREALASAAAPAEQSAEFKGWYCAHCQHGVDARDVTYSEQHSVCGRYITDDRPPMPAPQPDTAYAALPDAPEALQLKSCPCGATPTALQITGDEQAKWAHVSGNCCGEWEIEYRNNYTKLASTEAMTLAAAAWNEAPRASRGQAQAGDMKEVNHD